MLTVGSTRLRSLVRLASRHRMWTGLVALAVLAAVGVPLGLTLTGPPPVSAEATAILEDLSHHPAEARAYLDPGPEDPTDPIDQLPNFSAPLLTALLTRGPGSLGTLASAHPSLPGFPSYRSIGDVLLAAGGAPDDLAAERITDIALERLSDLPAIPPDLRPQVTTLIVRYLGEGYLAFLPGDRANPEPFLSTQILHGAFDASELDTMAHALVDAVADHYGTSDATAGVLALSPVPWAAQAVGDFLHTLYTAEVRNAGSPQAAALAEQHVNSERAWAATRLYTALTTRPTTASFAAAFVSEFQYTVDNPYRAWQM